MDRVVIAYGDTGVEVTVTDFKTDEVAADAVALRARAYALQMHAYAEAVSLLHGVPVRSVRVQLMFVVPDVLYAPSAEAWPTP